LLGKNTGLRVSELVLAIGNFRICRGTAGNPTRPGRIFDTYSP